MSVTHEKHGKLSLPVFPSARVWLWPGRTLFQETSGGLSQLVARETEARCLSPLENQGRGEASEEQRWVFQKASRWSQLWVGKPTDANLSHLLLSWELLQMMREVKQIAIFPR